MKEEAVGWRVKVFWKEENEWFEGVVTEYSEDQGYYVCYDDGDEKWQEDATAMEFVSNAMAKSMEEQVDCKQEGDEAVGWRVKVFWKEEQEWFHGVVAKYSQQQGYLIVYDDGEEKWHENGEINYLAKENDKQEAREEEAAEDDKNGDKEEYTDDEEAFEKFEESQMDNALPPIADNMQEEDAQEKVDTKKEEPVQIQSNEQIKEEELKIAAPEEDTKIHDKAIPVETLSHGKQEKKIPKSRKNQGIFLRDKETLLDMKNTLEAKKAALVLELNALQTDLKSSEQSCVEMKHRLQDMTTRLAIAKSSVTNSVGVQKHQSVDERCLDLTVKNRHMKKENIELKIKFDETKKRLEESKSKLATTNEKWMALPPQYRTTLAEHELEATLFIDMKKNLENELQKNSAAVNDQPNVLQTTKQELLNSEKNIQRLNAENQHWKRLLEQEKAKLAPLHETMNKLHDKLSQFRASKTLLRSAFDRCDVNKNGTLTINEAIQVLSLLAHQDADKDSIQAYFKRADCNGDQTIDFSEFCQAFDLLF